MRNMNNIYYGKLYEKNNGCHSIEVDEVNDDYVSMSVKVPALQADYFFEKIKELIDNNIFDMVSYAFKKEEN